MNGKLDQKENDLDVRIFQERFWHSVMTCNQGSSRRPGYFEELVPVPKVIADVLFSYGIHSMSLIWKSRTVGTSMSCGDLLAISSFVVLVGCSVDEHVQNHNSSTNRSLVRINSIVL